MDEKTVIAPPKQLRAAEHSKSLQHPVKSDAVAGISPDLETTSIAGGEDKTVILKRGQPASVATAKDKKVNTKPLGAKPPIKEKPQADNPLKKSGGGGAIIALFAVAALLFGLGSALVSIYVFSPTVQQVTEIADADLNNDIVAVTTPESEAEDEALIMAAIQPHIIELSGDPVILRQLANAPRQLVKLEKETQVKAASILGVKGDVFRLKDVLDIPNIGLQSGVLGSQEDIANAQSGDYLGAAGETSVIVANGDRPQNRINEFAQRVQTKQPLGNFLNSLGMEPEHSQRAEAAFAKLHRRQTVQKGDQIAIRAVASQDHSNLLVPMQISLYSVDGYVGSVAVNDIDAYADAADPWFGTDVFEAQLLPVEVKAEDQPRLMDAIYASALRNRLPAPVVGEAIMLLARAQDLEQKVEAGDTITIVYSPLARDSKTGLGRIVFVSIGRASGNLDCYVMQPQQGEQFECVAATGTGTIDRAGMVTPVNGIIVSKFGAPATSADPKVSGSVDPNANPKADMNFGVDWTAPKGSPVVAAYSGDVTAIGAEGIFGLVIRLTHVDNKTSMYGYLDRVQTGITVGAKITAGQIIGFVGTPSSSREPRLHFELLNNGVPVDPVDEMPAATPEATPEATPAPTPGVGAGAIAMFVGRIIHIESANRCNARNPLSTAVGLGQFIESTWMTTIKIHRPDLYRQFSRGQLLDMRTNCDLARAMTTAFTRDNAAVIRQAGHGVTPGILYLAHFLGVGGALKVLSNNPNRQIADVFGPSHVRANPFENGKSIGYLIGWAAKKMTGSVPPPSAAKVAPSGPTVPPATQTANRMPAPQTEPAPETEPPPQIEPPPQQPLIQYAADPLFAQLKSAVNSLLQ